MARDGSGRLTVTAIGPSGVGALARRQAVPSGGWDAWVPLSGWSATAPALAVNADGRLEAFTLTPGGTRLDHRWQITPGGETHPGAEFGEPGIRLLATPVAALDPTGRLHVFAVTDAGRVRARPGGGWQPWTAFGDRAVAPLLSGSPALRAEDRISPRRGGFGAPFTDPGVPFAPPLRPTRPPALPPAVTFPTAHGPEKDIRRPW
ncbi:MULTISPECIES: hypothetical protein [Streptomyces]|uniref:hypothetical protein n=1 Tax=Streptomyces TaxID=1883 RepID=UPI001F110167|nr:hypothetical protein [Streptomyces sp. S501]